MHHIRNAQHPSCSFIAVLFGIFPLLGRGIGMNVDGFRLEVYAGGINRDEGLEIDGEMVTAGDKPDVVDDIGNFFVRRASLRRMCIDNRHSARYATRFHIRHDSSSEEEFKLRSIAIVYIGERQQRH